MSDGAAPAPVAAASEPAEAKEPVEGGEAKQAGEAPPPKPRTIDDDIEDVFKKSGGLKYKAGGKEKSITTAADLKRLLSRVDGTDTAASEALKVKQEREAEKAARAELKKLPPRERLKALQDMGFDAESIRDAAYDIALEEDEKAKRQAGLTPEQRAFLADKEQFESERGQFQATQRQAKEKAEQEAYIQRVTALGDRLEDVVVKAFHKAKIQPGQAPLFLKQGIAEALDRSERLGLGLDESEIADVVMREHEELATGWIKGKSAPDLADVLETTGLAKALMEEFAKRLRAKRGSVPGDYSSTTIARAPAQSNGTSMTAAQKMAAARTFGGGGGSI